MIKINPTTNFKSFTSYKNNIFSSHCIYDNSKKFDILLNKLIYYKNRDVYFSSIRALVNVMKVEVKTLNEYEIYDFITIFNYVISVTDTSRTELGGWYFYINQDINDIENMTLKEFHKIIDSDNYKIKYIRKIKINKLSKL